jgi:DNA-binding LacI/PurR family transcriptional regulator
MPALKDIARASGVSPATVSRVLNNRAGTVGKETRDKVLRVMREMNYKPSALFYGENAKETRTVGVVMTHFKSSLKQHPYFVSILDGIMGVTTERHWSITLFTEWMWQDVPLSLRMYCDGRCDGLIVIAPPSDSAILAGLKERGFPCVLINAESDNPDFSTVDVDNAGATEEITRHLIELGHRRIAAMPGNEDLSNGRQRHQGYLRALEAAGLPYDEVLSSPGWFGPESGYERVAEMLRMPADRRPTAIVCGSDQIAVGVLAALRDKGIRVPGEMSVVGFDDLTFAATTDPPLTTVRQPFEQMSARATEILLSLIAREGPALQKDILPTELVIRESAGPCPA